MFGVLMPEYCLSGLKSLIEITISVMIIQAIDLNRYLRNYRKMYETSDIFIRTRTPFKNLPYYKHKIMQSYVYRIVLYGVIIYISALATTWFSANENSLKSDIYQYQISNFNSSLDNRREFIKLCNRLDEESGDKSQGEMSEDQYKDFSRYLERAYNSSLEIHDTTLVKIHPSLENHYRGEFAAGNMLILNGHNNNNPEMMIEGYMLLEKWDKWFDKNRYKIRNRFEIMKK